VIKFKKIVERLKYDLSSLSSCCPKTLQNAISFCREDIKEIVLFHLFYAKPNYPLSTLPQQTQFQEFRKLSFLRDFFPLKLVWAIKAKRG
jgi:hypothetical protein